MTSQIALFNSLGVAIASDTVTTHTQGASLKTTNNTEKIWPLGHPHLVVAVHNNSVVVNDFHVRNLISGWTRSLSDPLHEISEYPESIVKWLAENVHLLSSESQTFEINSLLSDHYEFIHRRLTHIMQQEGFSGDVPALFKKVVDQGREHLEHLPVYPGCTDEADRVLLDSEGVFLNEIVDDLFSEFDGFPNLRPALIEQAAMVLSRIQQMPGEAEIALVGFGSSDYFASSIRLHIRGCYGNTWRILVDKPFGANGSGFSGTISTFAQAEAIHGFLRGAQDFIINKAVDLVWDSIYQAVEGDADVEKAEKAASQFRSALEKVQWDTYVSPMLNTIGGLALTDLSQLAEQLVGIQAMRSAADSGPATVGGFIETLVISKAHGIQWVNRLPSLPK
jgi:hypothetical protein